MQTLFTTTDGIEMNIGTSEYWYCDERYKKYCTKVVSGQDYKKGIVQFSTEEKIDEYIQKNKPVETTMFDFKDYYDKIAESLKDNCRIAEVGNANGDSAIYLAKKLTLLGKKYKLYMIDNMAYGGYEQMKTIYENIIKSGEGLNIEVIPEGSLDASCKFNGHSLDFIFLDSSHLYNQTKAEIILWWGKLLDEGILAGHDYTGHEQVKKAVDEIIPITFTRPPHDGTVYAPVQLLKTYETDSNFGVWEAKKDFFIKLNS